MPIFMAIEVLMHVYRQIGLFLQTFKFSILSQPADPCRKTSHTAPSQQSSDLIMGKLSNYLEHGSLICVINRVHMYMLYHIVIQLNFVVSTFWTAGQRGYSNVTRPFFSVKELALQTYLMLHVVGVRMGSRDYMYMLASYMKLLL